MTKQPEISTTVLPSRRWIVSVLTLFFALTIVRTQSAQAQTFTVLHEFTGGSDGANPTVGLTMDRGGNLYGITSPFSGGGTAFKLSQKNGAWTLATLHSFTGGSDGENPSAPLVFGPDGKLYGTTALRGQGGNGTVFSLAPPATVCKSVSCPWTLDVLYSFRGENDGAFPGGGLIFDSAGDLYGTTAQGGSGYQEYCEEFGCGVAYELSPSNGGWSESILYAFYTGLTATPLSGVIRDSSGNLYGSTQGGGLYPGYWGTVYELSPSNGSWSQTVLYEFTGQDDGCYPSAGLLADGVGNFLGATATCGADGGGTVFELTQTDNSWVYKLIYTFAGNDGPWATLTMDAAGSLYGTTVGGGAYGYGSVFKLTPSNGSWNYTSLHDFTDGVDGASPRSSVIFDASGNLYGTAAEGGTGSSCEYGCGVVWEITP